jgi:predicted nucleotidyltransferase
MNTKKSVRCYAPEPFPEAWRRPMVSWAAATRGIAELWLFGSRAKGTSRPNSDVDVAISLMPGSGADDWALEEFLRSFPEWRTTIERIVGLPVSLTAIVPGTPGDAEVRNTGIILWKRTRSAGVEGSEERIPVVRHLDREPA